MFGKGVQKSNADIWSLFVTILWALNVREFRPRCIQFKCYKDDRDIFFCSLKDENYFTNSGNGYRQPGTACFCSTDACQMLQRE